MAIKERKIKASFEKSDINNLKNIMERKNGKYITGEPIYSKTDDRLLLAQGKSVSSERYETMERELRRAKLKNKPSPFYTERRTDYSYN